MVAPPGSPAPRIDSERRALLPKVRICMVSPLLEATPLDPHGGIKRMVHALTEELVTMGHDVTLFGSPGLITSAKLEPMPDRGPRPDLPVVDWIAVYMRMMELIYRRADEFDVLHFHTAYFPLSLFGRQRTPFLTTLHGESQYRGDQGCLRAV